ncbi:hypothetical protein TSMEX_011844 [Taenia solium]|eukprot:TsM_000779100 transcript=TsM_000779100 gene=TsM_000779100
MQPYRQRLSVSSCPQVKWPCKKLNREVRQGDRDLSLEVFYERTAENCDWEKEKSICTARITSDAVMRQKCRYNQT